MTVDQLALMAGAIGFFVSLLLQWLKKRWAWLDSTSVTAKQVTAIVVAVLGVFIAAKFQISTDLLWQAALAGFAALGTHKALLAGSTTPEGSGSK